MGSFLVDDSTVELLVNEWAEETAFQAKLRQQTLSKMPVLDQQGEQYGLVFDGVDDELAGDIQSVDLENCNIYLVLSPDVSLSGTYIFQSFYDSGNQDDQLFLSFGVIDGKPTVWFGDGATNVVLTGDDDIVNSEKQIWSFKSSGTTKEFFINNDLIATQTSALSATVNRMRLGSGGDEHYSPCSISGTPIYNVAKDTSQQYLILDFLLKRFGITDFLPPIVGNNGILTTSNITDSGFTINFTEATDNVDTQSELTYYLYTGTFSELNDINQIESQTLEDQGTNVDEFVFNTGAGTFTEFNILVEDSEGNKAIYQANEEFTLDPDIILFETTLTKGQEGGELDGNEFTGDIGDQLVVDWQITSQDGADDEVTVQSLNENVVTVELFTQTIDGEGSATLELQGVGELNTAVVQVFSTFYQTWANTPNNRRTEIQLIRYTYEDDESTESETWTYTTGAT